MEILALRAYPGGYRGCLIDDAEFVFFQYSRRGRCRRLKSYPRGDFENIDHFTAMMMKFVGPSAFMNPPAPIASLSLDELARVYATNRK